MGSPKPKVGLGWDRDTLWGKGTLDFDSRFSGDGTRTSWYNVFTGYRTKGVPRRTPVLDGVYEEGDTDQNERSPLTRTSYLVESRPPLPTVEGYTHVGSRIVLLYEFLQRGVSDGVGGQDPHNIFVYDIVVRNQRVIRYDVSRTYFIQTAISIISVTCG